MGITKYQAEDIFKSQFELVAKEMESRSDRSIRLPRIGTFVPNLKRREILNNKENERNQQLSRKESETI